MFCMLKQKPRLGSTSARLARAASPRGDRGREAVEEARKKKKFVRKFSAEPFSDVILGNVGGFRKNVAVPFVEGGGGGGQRSEAESIQQGRTYASAERDESVCATAGQQERVGV